MATPDEVAFVKEAVAPLCIPLHRTLRRAHELTEADALEHDMDGPEFGRERTEWARGIHRRLLMDAIDLGDWQVKGKSHLGQTRLTRGLMVGRLLHMAPGTKVPAPGGNRARANYYRNPRMNLFGVEASNLIFAWLVDLDTGEPVVQVARTVDEWKVPNRPKCDIDFFLPPDPAFLESLEFVPEDDDIMLPLDESTEEGPDGYADGG